MLLLDRNLDRLRWVDQIHRGRIMTLASNRLAVERAVAEADLVIGAVLVPGGRAPVVVTEAMVARHATGLGDRRHRDRPGRVRRGHPRDDARATRCTSATACSHYAVGNIPGAVPHTSTYALTNATLPYVVALADPRGGRGARRRRRPRRGVNTVAGKVVNPAVAEALGRPAVPLADALASLTS